MGHLISTLKPTLGSTASRTCFSVGNGWLSSESSSWKSWFPSENQIKCN